MSRVPWVLCVLLALSASGQEETATSQTQGGKIQALVLLGEQIVSAAAQGDVSRLRELLTNRVSPNIGNSKNVSALFVAAGRGRLEAVDLLLQLGADMGQKNGDEQWTALHYAAENNHNAIVRNLLDKGADCQARRLRGHTVFHITAHCGTVETMEILLNYSCDINDKLPSSGDTPLHFATWGSNRIVNIEFLANNGALMDSRDFRGNTALHQAVRNDKMDAVEALIRSGADVNARNNNTDTPLTLAQKYGNTRAIRLLLDNGALVNQTNTTSFL